MGSTGTGRFGDYNGGGGDGNRCDQPVETELEDVAQSAFYQRHNQPPAAGAPVDLEPRPINQRLAIKDTSTGLTIGVLPTKYNYLLACQGTGRRYAGTVLRSRNGSVPTIKVKIEPV